MIIARGEQLSCLYMTALLQDNGIPATFVDLENLIDHDYHEGPLDHDFFNRLSDLCGPHIAACQDTVPVVTGYFGCVPGGLLNTVGRGYTDLCAAMIAVNLHATELQIWKEVDGIFSADPRKVPTAKLIDAVTPAEAAELTFYGSEVIHPFTMDQVIQASIPIRIKNVNNHKGRGTIIWPDPSSDDGSHTPVIMARTASHRSMHNVNSLTISADTKSNLPTAITTKRNITVVNVHSNKRSRSPRFLATIFTILADHKLSVDLISSSEVDVSLALHSEIALLSEAGPDSEEMLIESRALQKAVAALGAMGKVDLVGNMAIISLVGKHLRHLVGVSSRFFTALAQKNVNIEMISQGASEINISCVIAAEDADKALNAVHTALFDT